MTEPIYPGPNDMLVDERDWRRMRDRIGALEDAYRSLSTQMLFYQQGCKERFDDLNLLLTRIESALGREKLG